MKRLGWVILMVACIALTWLVARRPSRVESVLPLESAGDRVVRLYDVADLFAAPVDDAEAPLIVTARNVGPPKPAPGPGAGNSTILPSGEKRRMDQLVTLITAGVDPASWVHPRANVFVFERHLVIVQTRQNHQLIADLLDQLRKDSPRHVRVEAIWALLTSDDLEKLLAQKAAAAGSATIDPRALNKLPGAIAWQGEATCRTGEQTRISCGQTRAILGNVEAQVGNDIAGFTGKTQQLLDGAMLEVTPSLDGDASHVLLELRSEVTRIGAAGAPIEIPSPQSPGSPSAQPIKLDPLNLAVQQLGTAVRGPSGAMLLAGGTLNPDAHPGDSRRLYLFVRATQAETAAKTH